MATDSSILAWRIPMDRGAWWATVCGVAKRQTQPRQLSTSTLLINNAVIVSGGQQRDSAIHTHVSFLP